MTLARRLGLIVGRVMATLARPLSRSPGGHDFVAIARTMPERAPRRPAPNKPCPCGSGRKWKRCCGAPK